MKSEIAMLADAFMKHVDIRDRRHLAISYKNCFIGSEAIDAMVQAGMAKTREEALHIGRRLQKELRLFRHIRGDYTFHDDCLFYRLKIPESILETTKRMVYFPAGSSQMTIGEQNQAVFQLAIVRDRTHRWRKYRSCFVGRELIDRMVYSGLAETRWEAVVLGRSLAKQSNLFQHVKTGKEIFADELWFYSFGSGALPVIYKLQSAEPKLTPSKIFSYVMDDDSVLDIYKNDDLTEKASGSLRMNSTARRNIANFFPPDIADDFSVLSALKTQDPISSEEDDTKIGASNSFDTYDNFVKNNGTAMASEADDSIWSQSTKATSKSELLRAPCGKVEFVKHHNLLGATSSEDEEEEDLLDNISTTAPPAPTSTKENSEDVMVDDSPKSVTSPKWMTTPHAPSDTSPFRASREKPSSSPSIQKSKRIGDDTFHTILINRNADDDDMTQITMDQSCFTSCPQKTRSVDKKSFIDTSRHTALLSHMSRKTLRTDISSSASATSSSIISSSETPKQRIAELLRNHLWNSDEKIVCEAMEELAQTMGFIDGSCVHSQQQQESQYRAYMVHCGGVMAMLRTMEKHLRNESIQYYGCMAMSELANDSLETQTAIREMDGISLIVQSMQCHVPSQLVQDAARSALSAICRRAEV